jgi:hypothetical protein
MTILRVQVNYARGLTEKWSNVWHADADSITDVVGAFGIAMKDHLLALLNENCSIVSVLISDIAGPDFTIVSVDEPGTDTSGGTLMPLFNCVKALFPVGLGRPDIKYLKGILTEDYHNNGSIGSTLATLVDNELTTMFTDVAAEGVTLVSDDAFPYANVSVQDAVQMRQMHRKRKKSTP